jgi:hypothetical protein
MLGVTGSTQQYQTLRNQRLGQQIFGGFMSWSEATPGRFLAESDELKATPFITWMPKSGAVFGSPNIIPSIITGQYDSYIASWATALREYKHVVYIRLAQEMNGMWSPWYATGPTDFIAAWRHVWTIFHNLGASNVRFVWSPDGMIGQLPAHWKSIVTQWYPGSKYVSYVGMTTVAFALNVVYGQAYFFQRIDFLHATYHKPMILSEMKVTYGNRYSWLSQLHGSLRARPWIKALVWSESPSAAQKGGEINTGNMDWSLIQDPEARKLLKAAVG